MAYFYTRHHQGIAHHETYQSQPEDNTETYQSITIAHPEDTSRIPEDTKSGHETPHSQLKQGMRHTRAYLMTL